MVRATTAVSSLSGSPAASNSSSPNMSSTNQLNGLLNGLGVGSGSQSSSGTSSAPNLFLGPSSSAATNPAAVNWTSSAGINGNNSRGIVTTAVASTGQPGASNAANGRLPEGWRLGLDQYGRQCYIDCTIKSTTWERSSSYSLPAGWKMKNNFFGLIYYFDHNTCSARWQRPTAEMLEAHAQWQSGRDQAMQYWGQRFLLQQGNGAAGGAVMTNDDPLGPLPEGWEKRFDTGSNSIYFANLFDPTMWRWEDPRIQRVSSQPFPKGWEMTSTNQGVPFFIDHVNKTTTYNDPRTGKPVGPTWMSSERTFRWKISQFRYRCLSNSEPNPVKITVSRTTVFEDSFQEIMRRNPIDLRRRLYIQFSGEGERDCGAVAREWFFLLSHEMLNPVRYLFMCAGNNNNSLQINPASFVNPDHLQYFEFIGRVIAMALFHGKFIHAGFMMPFYKMMLNKRITLKDIEQVDSEFYNLMIHLQNTNIDENSEKRHFVDDYELLGKWKTHELKSGGAKIRVTEATKDEYIDLLVQWRFNRGVEQQTEAFFNGFNSVFPLEWLHNFDKRELEMLLCGINRKYWKFPGRLVLAVGANFEPGEACEAVAVHDGHLPRPRRGFSELMGSTGLQSFCIEKIEREDELPRSHTSFNRLDLPPYLSYDHLAEKLASAVDNTEGFDNE
ncbi:hypothetical protein WR25_06779 [Diploscapter pachys]|uniref:HECT-type E3 ubiquitin transferase n=1 Tax=Diploscapter pachys TaxID=2018661 RepID=A0A2A2J3T3_9BILA|nr:hypothetical protein WR25_06779 [Diploscapter pachys]